jgi:hypothetical protein
MVKTKKQNKTMKWKASFSSTDTLKNWTSGGYYKCLLSFEFLGIKIVVWRKK